MEQGGKLLDLLRWQFRPQLEGEEKDVEESKQGLVQLEKKKKTTYYQQQNRTKKEG